MGVIGLWSILDAGARPVRLEALAKKRLAVDASIWIYQFLKAVRDKEGNVLKNAHVVGFFRRICKLLFHGIQPVFVFDGAAPLLKRQTLRNRKVLREGGRIDVAKTAGKILAVQMRKRAIEEAERQKRSQNSNLNNEEAVPENPVYFDELEVLPSELQKKKFKKADQYHLPEMSTDLERAGGAHDPRIMTHEELQAYAKDFEGGEDMNLYDFSKIDYDSEMFTSLPVADQYSILNAARLRSRLRMGLSTEQLTDMFPDRMAFSRFQIERVKERSDLTNRLMNINGMNDVGVVQRIASERGKEYILVKNENADGGWSLGVVNTAEKPIMIDIDIDLYPSKAHDGDDEEEFEDVPIGVQVTNEEHHQPGELTAEEMIKFALEESRRAQMSSTRPEADFRPTSRRQGPTAKSASKHAPLFTRDDSIQEQTIEDNSILVPVEVEEELLDGQGQSWEQEEADELRKAMALSLESGPGNGTRLAGGFVLDDDEDLPLPFVTTDLSSSEGTTGERPRSEMPMLKLDFSASMLAGKKPQTDTMALRDQDSESSLSKHDRPSKPLEKLQKAMEASLEPERVDVQSASVEEIFEDRSPPEPQRGRDLSPARPVPAWFEDQIAIPEPPSMSAVADTEIIPSASTIVMDQGMVDLTQDDSETEDMTLVHDPKILTRDDGPIDLDTQLTETTRSPEEAQEVEVLPKAESLSGPNIADPLADSPDWSEADEQIADLGPEDQMEITEEQSGPAVERETPTLVAEDSILDEADQTRLGEEEDMLVRMAAEESEYARFSAALGNKTTDNYTNVEYEQDLKSLKNQQRKNLRDADEVTQIMVQECQELLAQFGIPYLTATSEAESQCAKLVQLNLVDGIVTDDSDVFLFGGTRVYRNMFNTAKTVECYVLSDLEREFDLDREKLIRLAHLLGSDYTEGIKKIGPVLALELISEFTGDMALVDFKQYVDRVQSDRETEEDKNSPFRKRFKKTAEKLVLPDNFPNPLVREAYVNPEVDADTSTFEWGQPDVDALRSYLMRQCGWHQEYTDSQLLPVIKDMNVSIQQRRNRKQS